MASACGADTQANEILLSLTAGKDFTLPPVDLSGDDFKLPDGTGVLYGEIQVLKTEDLTTRKVGGDGTFDALMQSLGAHLKGEYEASRITGNEYTKAYIGVVGAALQTAASFLLGRDQAYWQAILAQAQARRAEVELVTAKVGMETAKAQLMLAHFQALNAEAEYGLTKMRIASEDANYCNLKAQKLQIEAQTDLIKENIKQTATQTSQIAAQTVLIGEQSRKTAQEILNLKAESEIIPKQGLLLTAQIAKTNADALHVSKEDLLTEAQISQLNQQVQDVVPLQMTGLTHDNAGKLFTNTYLLPKQADLLAEQVNVQRSQTLDSRTDNSPITGLAKAQKDLWAQQIASYKRDAEVKAAKIFSDAWITQKTIDEGLLPPNAFTNGVLDMVMATLKNNNAL